MTNASLQATNIAYYRPLIEFAYYASIAMVWILWNIMRRALFSGKCLRRDLGSLLFRVVSLDF